MKSPLTAQEKIFVCLDSNEMQSCKEVFEQNSRLKFLVLPLLIANENNFKVAIEVRTTN